MPQLLCSTGTFSRHPDFTDYKVILEYGPDLPVDGLEVLFYESWYPRVEQIAYDLAASGLYMPVVHAEKNITFSPLHPEAHQPSYKSLHQNCFLAREIGAKVLVFHLWAWRESDAEFDRTLDALPHCIDIAQDYGLDFAVETTPCQASPPLTRAAQSIQRDPRCRITLDTEFLAMHDQLYDALDSSLLWDTGRVAHMHIKDYDGQMQDVLGRRRYVHPGEGTIDFTRLFAALKAREYNGTISLESPVIGQDGSLDIPRLLRSLNYIRSFITE